MHYVLRFTYTPRSSISLFNKIFNFSENIFSTTKDNTVNSPFIKSVATTQIKCRTNNEGIVNITELTL